MNERYSKPSVTVDTVVLCGQGQDMRLLAVKRGRPPFEGFYAFPGGFLEKMEVPLRGALRELKEETGLDLPASSAIPLSVRGKAGRDPRGWTLTIPFLFWLEKPCDVTAGDDAEAALWVPLEELGRLAFDHGSILCEALGRFWPLMPSSSPKIADVLPFGRSNVHLDRAIFFGGSFNPWHKAHDACIRLCPEPEGLIIVPDANPFKTAPDHRTCFWRRYKALLTIANQVGAAVYPGFCGLEQPNPTAGWLPFSRWNNRTLLMGEDSFESLPQWYDAGTLVQALQGIMIVPRLGTPQKIDDVRHWVHSVNPNCNLQFLASHDYRQLSSTAIRHEDDSSSLRKKGDGIKP